MGKKGGSFISKMEFGDSLTGVPLTLKSQGQISLNHG